MAKHVSYNNLKELHIKASSAVIFNCTALFNAKLYYVGRENPMLTDFMPVVGTELFESKGMLMAVVTAAGILVVFVILILLIFIFYAYGGIFQAITASGEKKKAAKAAEEAAKTVEDAKAAESVPVAAADIEDGEISGEVIAVIAAAVAAMSDGKNYAVKKVKRAPASGRSAWAASGIFENTRPF